MIKYYLINLLILSAFLVMGVTVALRAQQYIGNHNQPNVVVNESVIESIAPRPNLAKRLLQIRGINSDNGATGDAFPSISSNIKSNKPSLNSIRIGLIPPGSSKSPRYKSKELKTNKSKLPNIHQPKKSLDKPKTISRSKPQRTLPTVLGDTIPPKPPKIIDPIKKVINTAETITKEALLSSSVIPPSPVFTNRQESSSAAYTKTIKPPEKIKTIVSALPLKQEKIENDKKYTIKFMTDSSSLDSRSMTKLSNILKVLKRDNSYSVQLSSYANSLDGSAIQARRISLSRALSARSHLIKNGIGRTRVEVRALGNNFGNEYPNRIDIVVRKR